MKYLKSFEQNNSKFKLGDYIIAQNLTPFKEITKYLENNVGEISDIDYHLSSPIYFVRYINLPNNLKDEHLFNVYKPVSGVADSDGIFRLFDENLRFATDNEIEDHLIKKNTIKYNL